MATTVGAVDVLPGTLPIAEVTLTPLTVAAAPDVLEYPSSGDDLVVLYNSTAGPVTVTMNAGVDQYGRADGAQVSTGAGNIVVFGPLYPNDGWPVGGGNLRITPSDPGVQVSCLGLGKAG
jgi:hypothetical protein